MKQLTFLSGWIWLSAVVALAQAEKPALKLTGLVSLPELKCASLQRPTGGWNQATLSEGQREDNAEVLRINVPEGSVDVLNQGNPISLNIGPGDAGVRLSSAKLQQVLDLYGELKARTVLQHPALAPVLVSTNATASTKAEAASALEELFRRQGMAVIMDGVNFVMITPAALTNSVKPHSPVASTSVKAVTQAEQPASNNIIPQGAIDFREADLGQALAIYGQLIGRKRVASERLPNATIRLRSVTPLTKAEAAYALETLMKWNGVEIRLIGANEFEAVRAGTR